MVRILAYCCYLVALPMICLELGKRVMRESRPSEGTLSRRSRVQREITVHVFRSQFRKGCKPLTVPIRPGDTVISKKGKRVG